MEGSPAQSAAATEAVRASGLIEAGSTGVVLCSGGADSACAAAGLAGLCGPAAVTALHINYGLRDDAPLDEQAAREICGLLGIELEVRQVRLDDAAGNVQASARRSRYDAAENLRDRSGGAWIATGHTRTDLAETVIYRLVASPGRRALLGLPPRNGHVVRPLLGISRAQAREIARAAGLPFRDDPSNETPEYARNRIRNEVVPVLDEIAPALEQTIAASWAELAEESEALEALAAELLERTSAGTNSIPVAELEAAGPALRRIALRQLAERAAGDSVALDSERCARIMRLAASPEGGTVELGSGVIASVEHGHVRLGTGAEADALPEQAWLPLPGRCSFGLWELRAELAENPVDVAGPEVAALNADLLGPELLVRSWEDGDRIRPIGLDGTKSLQDLFTDAKVPRSLRRHLPVVTAGERIAWVAGVAVSDELRAGPQSNRVALLHARART